MTELIFYDISSPLARSYAPNPSKSRFALSFKGVPFRTTWVDILDIAAVRQGLGCAAVRRFEDGSPFYTLPMLQDPASGRWDPIGALGAGGGRRRERGSGSASWGAGGRVGPAAAAASGASS
jgi:hypothetical protein